MEKNVGGADKVIRLIAGVAMLSQVVWGLQTMWGLLGLIFIGTAVMNYCPLYLAVGVNTFKRKLATRR